MQGLIGRKIGMTRLFDKESGAQVPITVIQAAPNVVHQIKTLERDGYRAVQLGFDICPEGKANKPLQGHFARHKSVSTRVVREFRLDSDDEKLEEGQKIGVEVLEGIKYVDVTGTSKGRGFAGTVKRHGFQLGRATHGNTNHRERGSIGASAYPARVLPGLKMAGQYGNARKTVKGLELVGVEKEAGLVYVKGAIPGRNKGVVFIRKNTVKN